MKFVFIGDIVFIKVEVVSIDEKWNRVNLKIIVIN